MDWSDSAIDGILDVTPVGSYDEDAVTDLPQQQQLGTSVLSIDAIGVTASSSTAVNNDSANDDHVHDGSHGSWDQEEDEEEEVSAGGVHQGSGDLPLADDDDDITRVTTTKKDCRRTPISSSSDGQEHYEDGNNIDDCKNHHQAFSSTSEDDEDDDEDEVATSESWESSAQPHKDADDDASHARKLEQILAAPTMDSQDEGDNQLSEDLRHSKNEEDHSSGSTTPNNDNSAATAPATTDAPKYAASPSEWDKALKSGKPSTGHATDFFTVTMTAPVSTLSADSSGFFASLLDSRVETTAAGSRDGSRIASPIPTAAAAASDPVAFPIRTVDSSDETLTLQQQQPSLVPTMQQSAATAAAARRFVATEQQQRDPPPPPPPLAPVVSARSAQVSPVPSIDNKNGSNHRRLSPASTNSKSSSWAPPAAATTTSSSTTNSKNHNNISSSAAAPSMRPHPADDLSAGVLPDVLMNVRQKIESLTLFDSDMMRLAGGTGSGSGVASSTYYYDEDPMVQESRESLKRSSQQSISAAVLVSLAHKRYERRRLAAMEIEKVIRSLVQQQELDRVRAILLLLSDDYVRSTSEDARKGGVVALAASAIGLKKARDDDPIVHECRDLILASVVHACQDHSQRVRYYATESLFNVVKVIPALAIQHFFILFEILRSLYADVDADVRSGADLLDKKLKEVIVGAMNQGSFTADACVPVFARFVYMRNKATKRLTLTWLQELNEKSIGSPILAFLHLFLGGIFDMVADPTVAIRQSALAFLQSVLPKLLLVQSEKAMTDDIEEEDAGTKVNFDKILQSLVTTMEHPDPFVRKVAMYWMSRIVKAHMSEPAASTSTTPSQPDDVVDHIIGTGNNGSAPHGDDLGQRGLEGHSKKPSSASISVRNSVPHVLPGILLSIGDTLDSSVSSKDSFLPDQTTRALAEQTNACLQDAVRREGSAYIQHLDGFIVALREELDSPGGLSARNPPAVERTPYRVDVNPDGTGIETPGWFRGSTTDSIKERSENGESMAMSRLCALHWVIVLYESVVPDLLKADYAREFVFAIINQLADNPPKAIVHKSLEVLAKITVPVSGEELGRALNASSHVGLANTAWSSPSGNPAEESAQFPMTDSNILYALDILDVPRRRLKSRDREVFSALIEIHAQNEQLLGELSGVITYMCKLQPPEFVFVSFAVELDRFIRKRKSSWNRRPEILVASATDNADAAFSRDLRFVSSFVTHMCHVLLNAEEAASMRNAVRDCIGFKGSSESDRQRARLFHILLHTFSHNAAATLSLCLWAAAYRTATSFLSRIDSLDISLIFLLEIDRLIEMLERPFFRHIHIRMLERDEDPTGEGSGTMLFQLLKSIVMILPQSTCYHVLKDRLTSVARFRQSAIWALSPPKLPQAAGGGMTSQQNQRRSFPSETQAYVSRVQEVRALHCEAKWQSIRAESLEIAIESDPDFVSAREEGADRRDWLGYSSKDEEFQAQERYRQEKRGLRHGQTLIIEEIRNEYDDLDAIADDKSKMKQLLPNDEAVIEGDEDGQDGFGSECENQVDERWKNYWAETNQ